MSPTTKIASTPKKNLKYKAGDKVWVECYGWDTNELHYVGPATTRNTVLGEGAGGSGDYVVDLPVIVSANNRDFSSWNIREEWVKYEL